MKTKRIVGALLVVSMMIGCLTGCGKEKDKKDTIVIGGLGPLTGTAASYGTSVKQGAEVAVEEINDNGGVMIDNKKYKLQLNFADDEANEETVVSAYDKLMDEGIDMLLGTVTSGACLAIVDQTLEDNLLQITPSGTAKGCTKNDNNFRLCFTDPLQGQMMAELAVKKLNYNKIAVIYNNADEYSSGMKSAFVKRVKELGGTVVAEEAFVTDDVDFNTQLTKIKGTDAQCIFIPTYYTEVSYIAKQAKEKGMKLPLLGGDGWDGILEHVTDKASVEGAIFLSPFLATEKEDKVKEFVTTYKKEYSKLPDQFAADGYDTVYVMKAALEKADSINTDALIKAMTKIEVEGVTGTVTFSKDGEPDKDAKYIEIKDGAYVCKTL